MSTSNGSLAAHSESRDGGIAVDLFPFLRVYNDGRVREFVRHKKMGASSDERSRNGVVTKDVVVDGETGVSVRLFLPIDAAQAAAEDGRRLPLVVYIHGGGFCTGSASAEMFHNYADSLAAHAVAVVVSVDYRLAPEHPIPAAYDDARAALRWAAASSGGLSDDAWVGSYADRTCMFLAGESSGANIVHNVALRAGTARNAGDIDIEGMILLQPYFWGTERLPFEKPCAWRTKPKLLPERVDNLCPYVTAGAAGNDDPRINPPAKDIALLPCRRALVAVATEDVLRDRGRRHHELLRDGAGWGDRAQLVVSRRKDHCFHLLPEYSSDDETKELMDHVTKFIAEGKTTPPISMPMEVEGVGRKTTARTVPSRGGARCCAAQIAPTVPRRSGFGVRPLSNKVQKYHLPAAALGRSVLKSYF
uniref:Alpha/beta hydrolase fold-3 domain-containing protein n=1 Tax=Oryza brachyantha TaxID=4533 RepID=J3L7T7_ORYBR